MEQAQRTVLPAKCSPQHVALWDAINEYAEACGGNASAHICVRRMNAVVAVEDSLAVLIQAAFEAQKRREGK